MATAEFLPARDRTFVGRVDELSRVDALVDGGGARVLFVHGISGGGKSALVRHVASRADRHRTRLVVLDCRDIEPTGAGFRAALSESLNGNGTDPGDGRLGWLGGCADRVVVCLDQYEVLRLLDTWLRQTFVPALPANVRLLIASREEPHTAWHRLPAGTFDTMRLGPLSDADSRTLLRELGVEDGMARSIATFAGGHPLTLLIGALAAREQPLRSVRDVTLDRLLDEFTRVYLDDLDPATHDLLQAGSVVRRVTRPLLAAMLPDVDAWRAFQALAALPFVERTSEGLAIHDAVRHAFRVARDTTGAVAGFFILTPSDRLDIRTFADDPVVAGWLDHLARDPIPASQVLLLGRRWLTWDAGEGLSPAQAAFWLDLKRYYMALRPRLRRNYGTTIYPEIYGQVLGSLGGGTIPDGAVELDGIAYHGLYLDFGPSSVDGWLTRLAADEVGLADDLLDVDRRQVLIDDGRVDLTPLEFEVLHYLRERAGRPVARQALLADIWGHDTVVGSNVVDVAVGGLRKKLGRHADMVETVRGVGYRFRTHAAT